MNILSCQIAVKPADRKGIRLAQTAGIADKRSLKGFYPAPALRQRVHYLFAHCFLPAHVHGHPQGLFDSLTIAERTEAGSSGFYVQGLWNLMEETYGLVKKSASLEEDLKVPLRRVRDLKTKLLRVADRPALVIEMPPIPPLNENTIGPNFLPLAQFVGAVLVQRNQARFFSVEQPDRTPRVRSEAQVPGKLCEWTRSGRHVQHGVTVLHSRRSFVNAMAALISG